MQDLFEKATKTKLRWSSPNGDLSVEELWELPLSTTKPNRANLNDVAKAASRQLKAEGEEDFVNPRVSANDTLELKLEIVKYIIGVKQAENAAVAQEAAKKEQKAKILDIISRKQDAALEGKPLDELLAMVGAL